MADKKRFTYQNQSEQPQDLINVGVVEPGKTVETDQPVHNKNFKLVDGGRMVNVEAPAKQPETNKTKKS